MRAILHVLLCCVASCEFIVVPESRGRARSLYLGGNRAALVESFIDSRLVTTLRVHSLRVGLKTVPIPGESVTPSRFTEWADKRSAPTMISAREMTVFRDIDSAWVGPNLQSSTGFLFSGLTPSTKVSPKRVMGQASCLVQSYRSAAQLIETPSGWLIMDLECDGQTMRSPVKYTIMRVKNMKPINTPSIPCEEFSQLDLYGICFDYSDLSVKTKALPSGGYLIESSTGAAAQIDEESLKVGCTSSGLSGNLLHNPIGLIPSGATGRQIIERFRFSRFCPIRVPMDMFPIFRPDLLIPRMYTNLETIDTPRLGTPPRFTAIITSTRKTTDKFECALVGPNYAVGFARKVERSPWYVSSVYCDGHYHEMFGSSAWLDLNGEVFRGSCGTIGISDSVVKYAENYVAQYCQDPLSPVQFADMEVGSAERLESSPPIKVAMSETTVEDCRYQDVYGEDVHMDLTQGGFFKLRSISDHRPPDYLIEPLFSGISHCSELGLDHRILSLYEPMEQVVSSSLRYQSLWGTLEIVGGTISYRCAEHSLLPSNTSPVMNLDDLRPALMNSIIPWVSLCIGELFILD